MTLVNGYFPPELLQCIGYKLQAIENEVNSQWIDASESPRILNGRLTDFAIIFDLRTSKFRSTLELNAPPTMSITERIFNVSAADFYAIDRDNVRLKMLTKEQLNKTYNKSTDVIIVNFVDLIQRIDQDKIIVSVERWGYHVKYKIREPMIDSNICAELMDRAARTFITTMIPRPIRECVEIEFTSERDCNYIYAPSGDVFHWESCVSPLLNYFGTFTFDSLHLRPNSEAVHASWPKSVIEKISIPIHKKVDSSERCAYEGCGCQAISLNGSVLIKEYAGISRKLLVGNPYVVTIPIGFHNATNATNANSENITIILFVESDVEEQGQQAIREKVEGFLAVGNWYFGDCFNVRFA